MKGVRVAVIGDVMLDQYVMGETNRISPEAPIPVVKVVSEQTRLGGAGNVARNIASMGGVATLVGLIGTDAAGRELETAAAEVEGLSVMLLRDPSRRTTVKTRFLARGQQLIRVDRETTAAASGYMAQALLRAAELAIGSASLVVLSDYSKGVATPAVIEGVMAVARQNGRTVIVDPKQRDMRCYAGAAVITPNASEAAAATNIECESDEGVVAAARRIGDQLACRHVIVTRGAKGMTLVDLAANGAFTHYPAILREVHDVSGAGDTAVAALALAIGSGASIETATGIANIAAGIAVSHQGTTAVTARELEATTQEAAGRSDRIKVVSCARAAEISRQWREMGDRVVFTNGCFDLLHPGHVTLLQHAKAEGDRLIVALNTDASVRRLKGAGRPIQGEDARALLMATMEPVDLVVLFEEDTPLAVIEAIRPDVLVKGADYSEDQVIGADFVRATGGKIVLVPLAEGHSTTAAIARATRGAAK